MFPQVLYLCHSFQVLYNELKKKSYLFATEEHICVSLRSPHKGREQRHNQLMYVSTKMHSYVLTLFRLPLQNMFHSV